MARKTIESLETKIKNLQPYEEAYYARKSQRHVIKSGEVKVTLFGVERASGGVVDTGGSVMFACDWCQIATANGSPYHREIASRIRQLQKTAVEARYAPDTERCPPPGFAS